VCTTFAFAIAQCKCAAHFHFPLNTTLNVWFLIFSLAEMSANCINLLFRQKVMNDGNWPVSAGHASLLECQV